MIVRSVPGGGGNLEGQGIMKWSTSAAHVGVGSHVGVGFHGSSTELKSYWTGNSPLGPQAMAETPSTHGLGPRQKVLTG